MDGDVGDDGEVGEQVRASFLQMDSQTPLSQNVRHGETFHTTDLRGRRWSLRLNHYFAACLEAMLGSVDEVNTGPCVV